MTSEPPIIRRAFGDSGSNLHPSPASPGRGSSSENTHGDLASPVIAGSLRARMTNEMSAQLDEFIDLVLERIEQRVLDELERRGRRGLPGAF